MSGLSILPDALPPNLAMLEPFAPVVALVLFDAEPSTVESLRDRLLLPPPTPHHALLTLLLSVDFARRPTAPWCRGPRGLPPSRASPSATGRTQPCVMFCGWRPVVLRQIFCAPLVRRAVRSSRS